MNLNAGRKHIVNYDYDSLESNQSSHALYPAHGAEVWGDARYFQKNVFSLENGVHLARFASESIVPPNLSSVPPNLSS